MSTPAKYRKLPVVIDAWQWDGTVECAREIVGWTNDLGGTARYREGDAAFDPWIEIETMEGTMRLERLAWAIRGVAGEFYPCENEIFRRTYEEAKNE